MLEASTLKHGFGLLLALLTMRLARQISRSLVILHIWAVSGEDEEKGKVDKLEQTYHRRAAFAMDVISGADASDLKLGISRHDYSALSSVRSTWGGWSSMPRAAVPQLQIASSPSDRK